MNISLLQFPNKSHRKSVLIPDHNANLAELLGIIFGDGAIGNPWQVVISLNSILDRKYASYVTQLFNGLFGITCAVKKTEIKILLLLSALVQRLSITL